MPILGVVASSISGNLYQASFDSIASTTVGAGGVGTITFSGIPQTYTHLQLRAFGQTNRGTYGFDSVRVQINGVSGASGGSGYTRHGLNTNGSTISSFGADTTGSDNDCQFAWALGTTTGSSWGGGIVDILDYTNPNKYKNIRSFGGVDVNGLVGGLGGNLGLGSNLFMPNFNPVTSITIVPFVGTVISQYSSFALYGIKVA